MKFRLHRERGIDEIVNRVYPWLNSISGLPQDSFTCFDLLYRGQIVNSNQSLLEVGIVKDAIVYV